ncbi:MAG: hypothetical protein LBN07_04235 [Christensenellaceae bacterium]|jgi:hypothetical protein|nr:hypothetical protein [Christensenellaceae bacterium]
MAIDINLEKQIIQLMQMGQTRKMIMELGIFFAPGDWARIAERLSIYILQNSSTQDNKATETVCRAITAIRKENVTPSLIEELGEVVAEIYDNQ